MKQDVALHTDADSMNINNNNKVVQGPAWRLYFYQQTANDNIIYTSHYSCKVIHLSLTTLDLTQVRPIISHVFKHTGSRRLLFTSTPMAKQTRKGGNCDVMHCNLRPSHVKTSFWAFNYTPHNAPAYKFNNSTIFRQPVSTYKFCGHVLRIVVLFISSTAYE